MDGWTGGRTDGRIFYQQKKAESVDVASSIITSVIIVLLVVSNHLRCNIYSWFDLINSTGLCSWDSPRGFNCKYAPFFAVNRKLFSM